MIPGTDEYRCNFWGYSTVNFFSPMARYSQVCAAKLLLDQIIAPATASNTTYIFSMADC